MGKTKHGKTARIVRTIAWPGLLLCALVLGHPLGCTNDDIGELLASGAIGSPGGAVRASNGAALLVPEFTLNAVYRFELLEVDHTPPANHNAVTMMIEVKPEDITFNESIPASLVLPLIRDRLPAGRSIWQIKAFRHKNDKWEELPAVIDDGNSTVTIPITATGTYAAFLGPAPPPAEPEPEPPTPDNGETTTDANEPAPDAGETTTEPNVDTPPDAGETTTETPSEPTTEPTTEPTAEPTPDASSEATPETTPETPAETSSDKTTD